MRVYHWRGRLIGESQERVTRAKSLPGDVGDEVDHLVELTSKGRKSTLDRRPRSRMATRLFQFTGTEERNTPKSELLRFYLLLVKFGPLLVIPRSQSIWISSACRRHSNCFRARR